MDKISKKLIKLTLGGNVVTILPPTVNLVDKLQRCSVDDAISEILPDYDLSDTDKMILLSAIYEICEDVAKRPELAIPYYPEERDEVPQSLFTGSEKMIADYANISVLDVLKLDIYDYRMLLRDCIIYNKMQTEDGRKWLKNAHRLTMTSPNYEKIRDKFDTKRGGKNGAEKKSEDNGNNH